MAIFVMFFPSFFMILSWATLKIWQFISTQCEYVAQNSEYWFCPTLSDQNKKRLKFATLNLVFALKMIT